MCGSTTGTSFVSTTTAPPLGAGLASVTVPVEEVPPGTVFAFIKIDESTGGVSVSVAVCVALSFPEIVNEVEVLTSLVVIGKVAEVAPCGTVTLAGTVASCFSRIDHQRIPNRKVMRIEGAARVDGDLWKSPGCHRRCQ